MVNAAVEYTDRSRWDAERQRLFRTLPLVAGFSCELAARGGGSLRAALVGPRPRAQASRLVAETVRKRGPDRTLLS
jgi:hypothetical protein